jgi:hypothetical protein
MAIVKSFNSKIIDALSGIVDFYYWKGIPVARQWPRKTTIPPSAAVLASRRAFTQSRIDLRAVSGSVRAAWNISAVGAKQSWLDYYTSIYLRMWRDYRLFPPVVTEFRIFEE